MFICFYRFQKLMTMNLQSKRFIIFIIYCQHCLKKLKLTEDFIRQQKPLCNTGKDDDTKKSVNYKK